MSDDFLTNFRKPPRPEFAKNLYERIDQPMNLPRRSFIRWTPALAGAGALILLLLVFTYPPAQAWAQDFLNLFRVKRFTAISIDPARLEQLSNTKIDFESLFARNVEVVKPAGEPQTITLETARQMSSLRVRTPSKLPAGMTLKSVQVQGEGILRVTADTARLQALLDVLKITDVKAPAKLNGAVVTMRKPPMVVMNYSAGRDTLTLIQSRSPEVNLPDGVNLRELGQIGLRVLGLNPAEAKQFAQTIDWNTTLIVPVPANAASFREVSVRNTTGLLITSGGTGGASVRSADGARQRSLLLWSEDDMVFALEGGPVGSDLVDFANALN